MHTNVEVDCVQIESNCPGEDRFCARRTEKVQAFGVMDGHGGYLAADIAMLKLLDTIIESLVSTADPPSDNDVVTIINEAFQAVDALILKEAQSLLRVFNAGRSKHKKRAGKTPSLAGSCAVVVIITNGSVFVAHVGDCRAVMISDQTELDAPNTDTNYIASGLLNTNDSTATPLGRKKDRLSSTKRKRSSRSSSRSKEMEREQVRVDLSSPSSGRLASSQNTSSPSIQFSPSPDGVLPFSDTKCNDDDLCTIDLHIQELYAQTLSRSSSLSSNGRGGSDDEDGDDEVKTELLQSESSGGPIQGCSEAEDEILMSTRQAVILGLNCDVAVDQQLAAVWRERGSGIGMTLGGSLCADLPSYSLGSHRLRSLTNDHACTAAGERWAMRLLTHDAHAIRPSGSDRSSTSSAPDRVAGSLAITRALGDGYLKIRELSFTPYKEYVPYITCKPTITYKKLTASDKKIVLASDGLWNYMSEEEVLAIAAGYVDTANPCSNADQSKSPLPLPSKPLATKCLNCRQRERHAVSRDFDVADPEYEPTAAAAPAEDEAAPHAQTAFKADFAVCGCLDSPCNPLCGSLWMLNSHVPKNTTMTSDATSGSHHMCHTGYRHVVDGGLVPAAALLRENEKSCLGYRSARSQLRWVCHDCGAEICDEHDNIQPQTRPLRLPCVVALRSVTLRSDADVSSPPLGRLIAGSSMPFDKIVRVAAIPGSTEAVYRLRVLVEGHQLTRASPHNALVGWVSLYRVSNDHQVALLEMVPGTAARAAQSAIDASELHLLHAHAHGHVEGEDDGAMADVGRVLLWEAGHAPPLPLERQSPLPSLSPSWSEAEISEEKKVPDSKALARMLRGGQWSRRRRSSSFGSFESGAIPTPLRKSLRLTPVHGPPSSRSDRSALLLFTTDRSADGCVTTSGHAKAGSAQRMGPGSQAISVGSDDEDKVPIGRSRRRTRYRSNGDMGTVGESGEVRNVGGNGVETERGLADHLLDECIDNAARNARMSSSALRGLDRGHRRRCILDDITVMVLDLQTQ